MPEKFNRKFNRRDFIKIVGMGSLAAFATGLGINPTRADEDGRDFDPLGLGEERTVVRWRVLDDPGLIEMVENVEVNGWRMNPKLVKTVTGGTVADSENTGMRGIYEVPAMIDFASGSDDSVTIRAVGHTGKVEEVIAFGRSVNIFVVWPNGDRTRTSLNDDMLKSMCERFGNGSILGAVEFSTGSVSGKSVLPNEVSQSDARSRLWIENIKPYMTTGRLRGGDDNGGLNQEGNDYHTGVDGDLGDRGSRRALYFVRAPDGKIYWPDSVELQGPSEESI